jgi:hypothetical protein
MEFLRHVDDVLKKFFPPQWVTTGPGIPAAHAIKSVKIASPHGMNIREKPGRFV